MMQRSGCVKKTDRNGTETRYTYNIYGNLLMRTAGELSERDQYTPEGLLKSAISGGMHYSYTYDTMGRMKEKTASGRKLLAFAYDKNGNLTGQEDVTGKVTEYRYNLLDQVTEVWDSGKENRSIHLQSGWNRPQHKEWEQPVYGVCL